MLEPHQLGEHLRPAHHGNAPRARRDDLGIVALDGRRNDDHRGLAEIRLIVADRDRRALLAQALDVGVVGEVRALDLVAEVDEHLGDARHADAADADEVDRADLARQFHARLNWAKRRKTAQGLALRARIVLACADGGSNIAVAARLRVNRGTVSKWRARFLAKRLDGLGDEPRPGVPRTITDAQVEEVVVRTLEEVPRGATHWSKRELAKRRGHLRDQCPPDLAGVRAATLAHGGFQDLPGPAAHR